MVTLAGRHLAFTPADHARITAAIREAEAATSGEIFAVFARSSDSYVFASSFAVLALVLAAGLLTALIAAVMGLGFDALVMESAQAIGAALLVATLRFVTPLRMLLVPPALQAERAHRTAREQFAAQNIHATQARTGILIFVSEAEHYAEVVADAGIDAKVPQAEWDAIVGVLTAAAKADRLPDGFVDAIGRAGRLLAAHFPSGEHNPNEIADRLVEI